MFHHAAWAVGSCSSGPPAAGTVGTQSTGGLYPVRDFPRRAKGALGSGEERGCVFPIDSKMAGQIRLKVGGMIEDMQENVLAKEFLGSVEV